MPVVRHVRIGLLVALLEASRWCARGSQVYNAEATHISTHTQESRCAYAKVKMVLCHLMLLAVFSACLDCCHGGTSCSSVRSKH